MIFKSDTWIAVVSTATIIWITMWITDYLCDYKMDNNQPNITTNNTFT